jgi:hypothetical protein
VAVMQTGWMGIGSRAGFRTGLSAVLVGLSGIVVGACAAESPSVGSASAELDVQPEVEVEPPVPPVLAVGAQLIGAPLRAGDHYLVAWLDGRAGWPGAPVFDRDLMAARVADDGTVLDPVGFVIGRDGADLLLQTASGACSDEGVCLFIAGAASGSSGPVRGIRVVGNQVLDPVPFVIAPTGGVSPGVVWDGQQFRVVYFQAGGAVTATVTADGQVGAPQALDLPAMGASIECGATSCLATTQTGTLGDFSYVGRMVDPTGQTGPSFVITDPAGRPELLDVLWDGARYWLSFVETEEPFIIRRVYLVRVSADGQVLDPEIEIVAPAVGVEAFRGNLGRADDEVIVIWQDGLFPNAAVRVARVAPDGAVLDPGGVVIGTPTSNLALACGPDACLGGTSSEFFGGVASVRGYFLDGTTLVNPAGIDVATGPPGQAEPGATFHDGRYVAVWRDSRAVAGSRRPHSIRGVLFPPTMDSVVRFATSPFEGSPHGSECAEQRDPKVAATSTSVMVTWHEECIPTAVDDSYAQAFGLDGQPLGPAVEVGNRSNRDAHPSIVSSGSGYVVLWEYEEPTPPRSVQMRRYDASGVPLAGREMFTRNGMSPVAAFDGTNYLVVWQRPQNARDLFAARMAPDGTILGADIPIATLPVIPETAQSVACGGGVCLVVWRHAGTQVRAIRVGPDGTVLDAAPLAIPVDGPVPFTSVTFDGEAFLLGWQEESGELRAAQVTTAGELVAPGPFQIVPASLAATHPVVISSGSGHRIALYDRYDGSPATLIRRVRARVIGDPATPTGDPDYVVAALGDPPASAVSGATFSVGATVRNAGGAASASSTTRFFLSLDTTVGGDRALTRTATVPPLGAGASDAQTIALSVPTGLASGSYFLLACADRGAAIPEVDERNNCRASASTVSVTGPDLVVESVGDPPPALVVGQNFSASDATRNAGTAGAASSAVAYYLSPTPTKGPGARRLSTTRSTGPIVSGATSSGQVSVKVPSLAAGTYYLVACADVSSAVAELDEGNNCAAAGGTTAVGPPTVAPPPETR